MDLIYSKPVRGGRGEWIDPVGDLPSAGVLWFVVIITPYLLLTACFCLGNWCGDRKSRLGWPPFLGLLL